MTLADANAAAKKYYRSDNLTMVLVGAASKIGEDVRKYDPNPVIVPIKAPGWGGQ